MSGPRPSLSELLRQIAQGEPLTATLARYPGLDREELGRLLESAADRLEPAPLPAPSPAAEPAPGGAFPRLKVCSDGAARGNPGPAGAGAVLVTPEGRIVERLGRYLGIQTNNVAEYHGLILGLSRALALGAREVDVVADSELMIRQLEGAYRVKNEGLKPLYEQVRTLLARFEKVTLRHVPRAQNAEADEMSNRAIDEKMG